MHVCFDISYFSPSLLKLLFCIHKFVEKNTKLWTTAFEKKTTVTKTGQWYKFLIFHLIFTCQGFATLVWLYNYQEKSRNFSSAFV